jgi:hypothetical protein
MKAPMKLSAGALASILQFLVNSEDKLAGGNASLLNDSGMGINRRGE